MYAKVGRLSDASGVNALRSNDEGALVTIPDSAPYAESVLAGRVYCAANQAAVALTAALATTYTGFVLVNPTGSGVNLVILEFGCAFTVAAPTAATVIGLMTGAGETGIAAAITPRNQLVGGAASKAIVDNGCTLPGTPVLERVYGHAGTAATSTDQVRPDILVRIDGSIVVPPAYFIAAYSFAANTACAIFHMVWEERPS